MSPTLQSRYTPAASPLFLQWSRPTRDLHSFPTRRSSDLRILRSIILPSATPFILLGVRLAVGRSVVNVVAAEDRKSTRLNSSHVAISYAVFCLKKKISYFQREHRPTVNTALRAQRQPGSG